MNNYSQTRLAHRPLSPVHCTSTTDHCTLNTDRCVLCRVHRVLCRVALYIARRPLNDARRPPVLVPRALVRAHCALHRGQSSSHGKRKNGTTMGTVLRIIALFLFVLRFLAALRRFFDRLLFVLRLKCCRFGLEFSEFCA